MEKISGISVLVGTAQCNANCSECAGRQHRKNAPLMDGEMDEKRLRKVLEYCYERNCKYITLTSSGEPTLSPKSITKILAILQQYKAVGKKFSPINLYTNGIRIGFDKIFCEELALWKWMGLTSIYVSVYHYDEERNAQAFGVKKYPKFEDIFSAIKNSGLRLRTSVILKKGYIDSLESFEILCEKFFSLGVDNISAWPLKDEDDFISDLAPSKEVIDEIAENSHSFLANYPNRTIRILLGDQNSIDMLGKKIALFQDGEISDVWCAKK